jgi:hypothetical protein
LEAFEKLKIMADENPSVKGQIAKTIESRGTYDKILSSFAKHSGKQVVLLSRILPSDERRSHG